MAVNVTFVPEQIVLVGDATMLTEGATFPLTAMVMPFDVAVAGLAHSNDDVITTVTISPFTRVLFE